MEPSGTQLGQRNDGNSKIEFTGWAGRIEDDTLVIGVSPNKKIDDGLLRLKLGKEDMKKMYCNYVRVTVEVLDGPVG